MPEQECSLLVDWFTVDYCAGTVSELTDVAKLDELGQLVVGTEMIGGLVLDADQLRLELLDRSHPLGELGLLQLQLVLLVLDLLLRSAPDRGVLDEVMTRTLLLYIND